MDAPNIEFPQLETLSPMAQFRWHHFNVHDHSPRLEQAWSVRETGRIEWREVPHFYEPHPPG